MQTLPHPSQRQPKGDHNRRVSMGLDLDDFAAEAGVTAEALREYEATSPGQDFDIEVARRVGIALERLEAVLPNSETGRTTPAGEDGSHEHVRHERLAPDEFTPAQLAAATIYSSDARKLGHVTHMYGQGPASRIVVDVGGFLGLGNKSVSVTAGELDFMRDEGGRVHAVAPWTREQLEQMANYQHH